MQATAARQARTGGGLERGEPFGQQRLGVAEGEVLLEPLGADTDPVGKGALEMRRAHPHPRGQIVERQWGFGGVDLFDRAADHVVVVALFDICLQHGSILSVPNL